MSLDILGCDGMPLVLGCDGMPLDILGCDGMSDISGRFEGSCCLHVQDLEIPQ